MVGGATGMSSLASCSRGVLRRSVSSSGIGSGLIIEVSKQLTDQCESAYGISSASNGEISVEVPKREQPVFTVPIEDFTGAPLQELLADLRALDSAVKQLDVNSAETQKTLDHVGSLVDSIPLAKRTAHAHEKKGEHASMMMAISTRAPTADSPTYMAYQKELAAVRPAVNVEVPLKDYSSSENSKSDSINSIEDVCASNRMMQRALAALQKRLKAVEKERDVMRAERDHFKNLAQRFPFTPPMQFPAQQQPVTSSTWPSSMSSNCQQPSTQSGQATTPRDSMQAVYAGLAGLGLPNGQVLPSCVISANMGTGSSQSASIGA